MDRSCCCKIINQTQAGEFTTYEFEQSDLMNYLFGILSLAD
jgi:hypothetical protein